MQIGSPGSMSLIEGGTRSISRSKITEDANADLKGFAQQPANAAKNSAPSDMIGRVETTSDGRMGVVVSANVVGRAPPSGLIVQVQVKPTDGRGAETGEDVADRMRQGLTAKEANGADIGVRQQEQLAPAERVKLQEMQSRDGAVRREEHSHAAAAGAMAGPIRYEYETGPDGRRYVVNGEISIQGDAPSGDPKDLERLAQRVSAAAMSAQAPSAADYSAAATGYQAAGQARAMEAENREAQRGENVPQGRGFSFAV